MKRYKLIERKRYGQFRDYMLQKRYWLFFWEDTEFTFTDAHHAHAHLEYLERK